MMKVTTYDAAGREGAEAGLPSDPFDGAVNESVLHQVVMAHRTHARQGNASTKNRTAVAGGSRKPWRQKGTGRARQGTIRAGQWRGGGRIFGPSPRDYQVRVPKSVRRLAIRSALNARAVDGDLALVSPIELEGPSTKTIASLIAGIGATGSNVLLLTAGAKTEVHLSARNIPGVVVRPWGEASAYDVLWADLVLIESDAFEATASVKAGAADDDEGVSE
ncbi:MAG: 50S ribosomal protein L4 [Acidobacteriota bacterium]|nr:50S ribosomal protein L4 [Acidobacteriota bacterium]